MPLVNVSMIVNSPAFAQGFTINRSTNSPGFGLGGYSSGTTQINMWGAIQPIEPESLDMTPEGDRVVGQVEFISQQPIYETNPNGISDTMTWRGQLYRIISVKPWSDNGYYRAVGTRMSGE